MIGLLRGSVERLDAGELTVDVSGVGYRVSVPLDVWEGLTDGQQTTLWISTYVREERLDLFGFRDRAARSLFEELLKCSGIGPRTALELLSVPRKFLAEAAMEQDLRPLLGVRGIGRKTAEKLLLELRSLAERKPALFQERDGGERQSPYDRDAVEALVSLGYESSRILHVLRELPRELRSTEERVAAALRAL